MPEMRNRVEIMVPHGQFVVRQARCPQGCDLMDAEHPIHDHHSIHVEATCEGQTGSLYLDPVYGSHDNIAELEIPKGEIVEFTCPHCGTSLSDPDRSCAKCSAGIFTIHLPKGGFIEACRRGGCLNHRLQLVTGEQAMQRVFDELGMDAFL
ncbi:MAG: hypothetical protein KAY32_09395 [Candidatus Eisenbacteria sp.]|nr:hypothetical protein [Candidatus Eisenbacteria bacterium]